MSREPIRHRRNFQPSEMPQTMLWGIRRRFHLLSPCDGHVAHALRTLPPVAARCIATSALPLDLHVLSLSLAFILSQDQTLRCCIIVSSISRIMKTQRRFVPCPGAASLPGRIKCAVLCCLTCLRNLDVDSGVSLPCLCTVNFLIANISKN